MLLFEMFSSDIAGKNWEVPAWTRAVQKQKLQDVVIQSCSLSISSINIIALSSDITREDKWAHFSPGFCYNICFLKSAYKYLIGERKDGDDFSVVTSERRRKMGTSWNM